MSLTQSEIDAIKQEAEFLYPENGFGERHHITFQAIHISAAKKYLQAERQRARVLVDGLETVRSLTKQSEIVNVIIKTLNTYNKNKPNDRE